MTSCTLVVQALNSQISDVSRDLGLSSDGLEQLIETIAQLEDRQPVYNSDVTLLLQQVCSPCCPPVVNASSMGM